MGLFSKIVDLVEGSVPEFATAKVVPRGTVYVPDLLLKGSLRFAMSLGNNMAMINPENETYLTENVQIQSTLLPIPRNLFWWEREGLVTFNGIEMYTIQDWDDYYNYLYLREPLSSTQLAGTKVTLWAVPIAVHTAATSTQIQLAVRSKYKIANGDFITFPTSDSLSSLNEVEVLLAQEAGDSGDSAYPLLYNLILKSPLGFDLTEDSKCYLRAFPAYFSEEVTVPKLSNSQMGPFLVDYASSPLDSVLSIPETFSIQALSGAGQPLIGTLNSYQTVSKNFPITARPIWADSFLFMNVVEGSGGFSKPNTYKLITNEEGKAKLYTSLVPELKGPVVWKVKVKSSAEGILRIKLGEQPWQTYTLSANTLTPIEVHLSAGEAADLTVLCKLSSGGGFVDFGNWNVVGSVVDAVRYNLVFKITGTYNFQSTGLLIKPLFNSLSDLASNHDNGSTYNSGSIYL